MTVRARRLADPGLFTDPPPAADPEPGAHPPTRTERPPGAGQAGSAGQVRLGDRLPDLDPAVLRDLDGRPVGVPAPDRLVHLQLRRFAGCPVCNLHLRSIVARHDEITAAGIDEVVVFHAGVDELRRHAADLPFPVVADPDKVLYRTLGVESSKRSILDPRAWRTIARALAVAVADAVRGRGRPPALFPTGGRYGLPADLLVAPDGTVVACRYGEHADDQWSVDELLAHASA